MASSKYSSTSFRPFGGETESKSAEAARTEVKKHEALDWSKEGRPTYSQIKETFAKEIKKKDQRFFLSELVANQLSVEEEDRRRFELRLKDELEVRVAEIKAAAYEDGFSKGLEKGVEKAFGEERARIAARMESLALVVNQLADGKEKLSEQYEHKLTDYAFQIAEIIIESEIKNRPESVMQVVQNALELLSKEEDVKVFVGLVDKDHLSFVQDELAKMNRKGSFTVELRSDLAPGDVIVQAMSGEVSARVQDRIDLFRREIFESLEQSSLKKEAS